MTEVPADSRLAGLRHRLQHADATKQLEVAIPETDPPIWLRFRRAEFKAIMAQQTRVENSKDPEAVLRGNAALVADYCVGVFDLGGDAKLHSIDPDGPPPTFKDAQRLAELFDFAGLQPTALAIAICGEGGVIDLADKLCTWSGFDPARRVQELRGE